MRVCDLCESAGTLVTGSDRLFDLCAQAVKHHHQEVMMMMTMTMMKGSKTSGRELWCVLNLLRDLQGVFH